MKCIFHPCRILTLILQRENIADIQTYLCVVQFAYTLGRLDHQRQYTVSVSATVKAVNREQSYVKNMHFFQFLLFCLLSSEAAPISSTITLCQLQSCVYGVCISPQSRRKLVTSIERGNCQCGWFCYSHKPAAEKGQMSRGTAWSFMASLCCISKSNRNSITQS